MADQKISQLSAVTSLAGTEEFVLASSGATKKITGANLKSAVSPTDGWTDDTANTWTYASATTFTVSGDRTGVFAKGTRLKLTQTTVKYFVVVGSSHAAGTTTVTLTGGTDYTLANAAISANYFSYSEPPDYPTWFNYTPANITGWGSNPFVLARFRVVRAQCFLELVASGTSNATTVTFDLPITAVGTTLPFSPIKITNNGTSAFGRFYLNTTSQIKAGLSATSDTWTASGLKEVTISTWYTI